MNAHVNKLASIGMQKSRNIIGLMSGTSLDGLDIAYCHISGAGSQMKLTLRHFKTRIYNDTFKRAVREVFAKKESDLETVCLLNGWIAEQHSAYVLEALEEWKIDASEVDLIASHGQTVYHSPKSSRAKDSFGNGTMQLGDGDHLAVKTGIITLSDFRQKHIAAGGEGAPLAGYGDYLLFGKEKVPVILLNIGGISNITWLPVDGKMFSSDLGPGNTMMDAWMQRNFSGLSYDENAMIGFKGKINEALLEQLKAHPFFDLPIPKTTGPELFNLKFLDDSIDIAGVRHIDIADVMATLNKFTADCISSEINKLTSSSVQTRIYVSGGGLHNPLLFQHLIQDIKFAFVDSSAEKNIDPDAKEAILFAVLANECIAGKAEDLPQELKHYPPVSLGKISFPG